MDENIKLLLRRQLRKLKSILLKNYSILNTERFHDEFEYSEIRSKLMVSAVAPYLSSILDEYVELDEWIDYREHFSKYQQFVESTLDKALAHVQRDSPTEEACDAQEPNIIELGRISNQLHLLVVEFNKVERELDQIADAANEIGRSFCGSWLGYHSCVYYENFAEPPNGARFNPEWGLILGRSMVAATGGLSGSVGAWVRCEFNKVQARIYEASQADLEAASELSKQALSAFRRLKPALDSIVETLSASGSEFLANGKASLSKMAPMLKEQVLRQWLPNSAGFQCRDSEAMALGSKTPPHIDILCQIALIRNTFHLCDELANTADQIRAHVKRLKVMSVMEKPTMNKEKTIFIGHGRSTAWRDLKDFITDRLKLEYEEFNSLSAAGMTTVERLEQMLDKSSFAFLVMTAEDETKEGKLQARLNVVHEIGLFQGRLGFKKGIVLLEEGCEEFSNITGLVQIRFPKNNIKSKTEEIRAVLEREGLISPAHVS